VPKSSTPTNHNLKAPILRQYSNPDHFLYQVQPDPETPIPYLLFPIIIPYHYSERPYPTHPLPQYHSSGELHPHHLFSIQRSLLTTSFIHLAPRNSSKKYIAHFPTTKTPKAVPHAPTIRNITTHFLTLKASSISAFIKCLCLVCQCHASFSPVIPALLPSLDLLLLAPLPILSGLKPALLLLPELLPTLPSPSGRFIASDVSGERT